MKSSCRYFLPFYLTFFMNASFSNEVFGKFEIIEEKKSAADKDVLLDSAHVNAFKLEEVGIEKSKSSSVDLSEISSPELSKKNRVKHRKIFLLSLDGGAIRGIVHAHVLAHLEKLLNMPIVKVFSGVAGASTGAIVALGIGIPNPERAGYPLYSAEEVQNMYLTEREHIFEKQSLSKRLRAGEGAFRPKYAPIGIEETFEKYYNDYQLSDLLIPTSVPVTEISEGKGASIMSSLKARRKASRDYLIGDVARATSAAPGFFPSKEILKDATGSDSETSLNFWDGGMFANNPSEIVLLEAQKAFPHAKLSDFVLLSIGTGEKKIKISQKESQEIGYVNGGHKMVRTILGAQKSWVDKKLKSVLGQNYIRLQVDLGEAGHKHDDVSIDYLEALYFASEQMIEESHDKIMYLKDLWDSQKSKKKSAYEYFTELQMLISIKDSIPLSNKRALHAIYEDYCVEHKLNPNNDGSVRKMIRHIKNQASLAS
ncbi:MAG: patatin-like phospholipase family protein [Alphaproteobacteria bacterium]|nr:patatin-like phospholipase family protein [Alphaproteobacteria bacterium]